MQSFRGGPDHRQDAGPYRLGQVGPGSRGSANIPPLPPRSFLGVKKRGNENPREGDPGGFKAKVKNFPRSRTLHRGLLT